MIYALRKLIAFVFLGGMFWFIYQDLGNLDQPWFMHALGLIAVAFAFFWLLIPMVVVRFRIRRRRVQNQERHAQWLAAGGLATLRERPARNAHLALDPGERTCFHEKGTLYVCRKMPDARFPTNVSRPIGCPSDVAFPGFRQRCFVVQRTHCYVTNRRVIFVGKDLDVGLPLAELKKVSVEPGGIIFGTGGGASGRFAFTFQNPLIAADVLRFAQGGCK